MTDEQVKLMSDYVDTRDGWREVSSGTYATARGPRLREDPSPDDNGQSRYWIKESLVTALPTEPYTVIRVTGRGDAMTDLDDDRWFTTNGTTWTSMPEVYGQPSHIWHERLRERITDFEVLSEPREITMEHVLSEAGGLISTDGRKFLRSELGLPQYPRDER